MGGRYDSRVRLLPDERVSIAGVLRCFGFGISSQCMAHQSYKLTSSATTPDGKERIVAWYH